MFSVWYTACRIQRRATVFTSRSSGRSFISANAACTSLGRTSPFLGMRSFTWKLCSSLASPSILSSAGDSWTRYTQGHWSMERCRATVSLAASINSSMMDSGSPWIRCLISNGLPASSNMTFCSGRSNSMAPRRALFFCKMRQSSRISSSMGTMSA